MAIGARVGSGRQVRQTQAQKHLAVCLVSQNGEMKAFFSCCFAAAEPQPPFFPSLSASSAFWGGGGYVIGITEMVGLGKQLHVWYGVARVRHSSELLIIPWMCLRSVLLLASVWLSRDACLAAEVGPRDLGVGVFSGYGYLDSERGGGLNAIIASGKC